MPYRPLVKGLSMSHPGRSRTPSREGRPPAVAAGCVVWAAGMALRTLCLAFLGLAAGLCLPALVEGGPAEAPLEIEVRELLKNRIASLGPPSLQLHVASLETVAPIERFYAARDYRPAWLNGKGLTPEAWDLLKVIRGASEEGLCSRDYHREEVETLYPGVERSLSSQGFTDPRPLVDLDLLLTDAFFLYALHCAEGRVPVADTAREGFSKRSPLDPVPLLQEGLRKGIGKILRELLPGEAVYARTRGALALYREILGKGGWPLVPTGAPLREGDRDSRVKVLRERLTVTGDYVGEKTEDPDLFDGYLGRAVRRFQARHGLGVDGVVGNATSMALNAPVEERIEQILLNMERWRWLPRSLGSSHILVNMADFDLRVVEEGRPVLRMRVIVGKDYRQTPVLSDRIRYLVLNPYWHVPHMIAVEDMLPQIRKDPEYLRRERVQVFRGWGNEAQEVDPAAIDWSRLGETRFPYRLRQEPGPQNALGQIKFMFPNRFGVYLHDTPKRSLFNRAERLFSSGCIRIEKPLELAAYLLREDPRWTMETLQAALAEKRDEKVMLPRPEPIHLLYCTAWAEPDGTVHFRRDIYGRDRALAEALNGRKAGDLR